MKSIHFLYDSPNKRKVIRNILLLIPGIAADFVIHSSLIKEEKLRHLLVKLDTVYLIIIGITICNSLLLTFLDIYSKSDRSRHHPLKGVVQALQIIMAFIGIIIITATLIGKSPAALLTGLGASAAVLMLIFKDSILGFVSGAQLVQNNMIRLGDWIEMPDGSADGIVEEITLNTVKVRNWDNTISTIPPYTLISSPFKNWRGMMESSGRRVNKRIMLDVTTIKMCSEDMVSAICSRIPMMKDYAPEPGADLPTNSQLYRIYIVRYLKAHPIVAQHLDLFAAQREVGECGLPIEVYFFITNKQWEEFEAIQSDIFDHFMAMAEAFELKLYQLPPD